MVTECTHSRAVGHRPAYLSQRSNLHSQYGEDGLLEWILSEMGKAVGYFVEFGAWDGRHLSNCRALFERGWSGCFIEGSPARFRGLQRTYEGIDRVSVVEAFVEPAGDSRLDAILGRTGTDRVDVLSIDIDSDDLSIWRSVKAYRPMIVVIEYNPTIPFDTRFENPPGRNAGNSALSIVEYATASGYDLVAGTYTNLVFVDGTSRPDSVPTVSLQQIKDHAGGAFRYFFAYDGTLLRESFNRLRETEVFRVPWSDAIGIQPIPRFLRHFDRLGPAKALIAGAGAVLIRPIGTLRAVLDRLSSKDRDVSPSTGRV